MNWWDVTIGPYVELLGPYIWAILLYGIVGIVWFKAKSFGLAAMMLMVGGLMLASYIPGEAQILVMFGVAIGVLYTFYRLLVRAKT